jgi:acyl-coenzyme A synthetase/AMP-(fatty) acid ligase
VNLAPASPGEIGDLYISGAGLSPGYWRNPTQTETAFLSDPARGDSSARIYKTGDLARFGTDGQIYLVGRADSQIKSRGYRIELGEIETALRACAQLQEAAVVAVEGSNGEGKEICCAFVAAPGSALSATAVKEFLAQELPRYMIPTRWIALDAMPRNANGKTDRPSLRHLFEEQPERAAVSNHAR